MKKKSITKIKFKNSLEYSKLIKNKFVKSLYFDKKNRWFDDERALQKSQKDTPLISIVMPNYKSKMLSKSLNSLFNQSYKNLEIIVIDGNSGKIRLRF